jgi:cytidylate kinase
VSVFRVITVAREFGSGGAAVAKKLSDRLGWRLLDRALLDDIARAARVDTALAERFDECVDPWIHRLAKQALWMGGLEGVAANPQPDIFDSEQMASLAQRVVTEAAAIGSCVIVGRGAQCILAGRDDVLHAYVYAPWSERVRRIRQRTPACRDVAELIRSTDRKRAAYIQEYFQKEWRDLNLYDVMVNSKCGEEAAAAIILCARGA